MNKENPDIKAKKSNPLFFEHMSGVGLVYCMSCDFKEEITGYIHGFGEQAFMIKGCQCQQCGEFNSRDLTDEKSNEQRCECGGTLDDEQVVFCPKCRSKKMDYFMSWMT